MYNFDPRIVQAEVDYRADRMRQSRRPKNRRRPLVRIPFVEQDDHGSTR